MEGCSVCAAPQGTGRVGARRGYSAGAWGVKTVTVGTVC